MQAGPEARFARAAGQAFGFLETEHGWRREADPPGEGLGLSWQVRWVGDAAALRLHRDGRERVYDILLGAVREGRVAPGDEVPLWAVLRARRAPEPQHNAIDHRVEEGLAAWAAALREHAADALLGERAAFGEARRVIEAIVAEREARDAQDRAREAIHDARRRRIAQLAERGRRRAR